jgi:transposase/IS5 family transposase
MLGREREQRSFFDASLAVEDLLEPGSFYEVLHRHGPRLLSDDDFLDCYDVTTGRPSVPPSRMFRLLLLQIYEDLSDRQALERMAFDLRWKAVLGLEVQDRAVGQATLVEFRARLQLHRKMEEAFERFLAQAAEVGLIEPDEVQVLDSSAIWGRGAVEDTYNLIGSAVRRLLGATGRTRGKRPEALAGDLGLILTLPVAEGSLKGRAGIDWSSPEERRAFLNEVVQEARLVLQETALDATRSDEVAEAAEVLRRILVQDLEPVQGSGNSGEDSGSDHDSAQKVLSLDREVQIRRGVAPDRIVSAADPEMRHGHKSQNRTWEGYKAHISVTAESEFVTAVHVTPANVQDGEAAPELLEAQQRVGLSPSAFVGDMAYSAAELRIRAEAAGTEIVAQVPPASAPSGCFSKDAFTIDLEQNCVTCPAGQIARWRHGRAAGRTSVYFDGAVCASCHLREACTPRTPETMQRTGKGRTISIHPLEGILQQARAAQTTDRIRKLLKLRPVVERRLGHLMGRGLRQARYRGREKTQFQAVATALIINLARFGRLGGPRNSCRPGASPLFHVARLWRRTALWLSGGNVQISIAHAAGA